MARIRRNYGKQVRTARALLTARNLTGTEKASRTRRAGGTPPTTAETLYAVVVSDIPTPSQESSILTAWSDSSAKRRLLGVAFVIIFVVLIVSFVVILFVVVFFVWLFSNKDIDGCRAITTVWVEVSRTYSAHA